MSVNNVGTLFYDARCGFCSRWAGRLERTLRRRNFKLAPLDAHVPPVSDKMIVEFADGRRRRGADAVVALGNYIWWLRPLRILAAIPGGLPLLRAGYRFVAAKRHGIGGTCRVRRATGGWLPLALLPLMVIAASGFFADWVFMWLLAFAIFFGFKWLTWRRADRSSAGAVRSLLYLLAWPGMDAQEFLASESVEHIRGVEWVRALFKTIFGTALLGFGVAGIRTSPLLSAWAGMIGVILLLHFGVFQLLSLIYRSTGIRAKPVMLSPALASSPSDFWANRWNTGFRKLAHDFLFQPLVRRTGIAWTTLLAFIASGLVHDLVISLPARGGYGLPTAYFVLQGLAILLERSHAGRLLGLRDGLRGRLFMFTVTALPIPVLFHPAFVRNIFLPMLQAIGRYWGAL